jgi:hypothetical protein
MEITESTRRMLEIKCREICQVYGLGQVYVAEVIGPCRRYLAGYGRPEWAKPQHMALTPDLAMFWYGQLSTTVRDNIKNEFEQLMVRAKIELAVMEVAMHPIDLIFI